MTDTYDADGKILSSGGRVDYSRGEIEAALAPVVGQIQQVPPIYSALKRDGQPLHKLARQGKEIQLEPRAVEIEEINLLDWTSPSLIVELTCSPGTYVRSLAHDLGQRLGGGAHLAALVRLASGRFGLDKAVSLERLETAFQHGQEGEYLLPVDEALLDWPATIVTAQDAQRLGQGQAISGYALPGGDSEVRLSRAYSSEGVFLGILAFHAETGCWRPKKVFVTS